MTRHKLTTADRWTTLLIRCVLPVDQPSMELIGIGHLFTGDGDADLREWWTTYVAAHPPTIATPSAYSAWAAAAYNADRARRGLPVLTADEIHAATPLGVWNSAGGLGDAVSGLYAACGLADATGRPVLYRARFAEWLAGVRHPGVTIEPAEWGQWGVDLNGGTAGYERQLAGADSRVQAYCDNVAAAYGLPTFGGVRPAVHPLPVISGEWYVVLSPFSAAAGREWPARCWAELAQQLTARGVTVHAVGSADQRARMAAMFRPFSVIPHCGASPADVIRLLQDARCVVANDSGLAHVGGLIGAPTVCVHAGSLPHGLLFGLARSVVSVTALGSGRGESDAAALAAVPVGDVLEAACDAVAGGA